MKITRSKMWKILEPNGEIKPLSRFLNIFIIALIVANVVLNILGTIESFEKTYSTFLWDFELISVIIFTVEYSARMWACTADFEYSNPVLGRIKFFFTPMVLIDFAAIFPFYMSLGGISLMELRLFRLFRILRLAKIGRYCSSLKIIKKRFDKQKRRINFICFYYVLYVSHDFFFDVLCRKFGSA